MATALVTGCSTGIGSPPLYGSPPRASTCWPRCAVPTPTDPHCSKRPTRPVRPYGSAARRNRRRLDSTRVHQAGDVDLVVNNAAIMWFGSTEETDVDRWAEVFDTNLFGAVRCMRVALPGFRARGGGCIINISSAAGSVALPAISAYASSKAALEAASEMVAMEGHQHNIRVVVIQTGATATAIGAKGKTPNRDSPYWASMRNTLTFLAAQQPSISSPDEIAAAVAQAAVDPTTPFRLAVGQGSAELIQALSAMTDAEWIATAGGTTDTFTSRYQQATGINLRPR